MSILKVDEKEYAIDKEGYLKNIFEWNHSIAIAIAEKENITLSEAHWEIILLIRNFYSSYQIIPVMRILIKKIYLELGETKGSSPYLMGLFSSQPIKILAKIAGLPKPSHCF